MTPKVATVPFKDFEKLRESLAISIEDVTRLFGLKRWAWNYWKKSGRIRQKYYDFLKDTHGTKTLALDASEFVPFKELDAYCKTAGISLNKAATYAGLTEGAGRYWRRAGRVPKQHMDALQSLPMRLPEITLDQAIGLSPPKDVLPKNGWRLSDPNEMFHFMAVELRNGAPWKILLVLRDDKDPDLITTVKVP